MTGPISSALGDATSLERLGLGHNGLTGSIPSALTNLVSLERLALNDNGLAGPLPPALGNLTSLERLVLNDNALTGSLPLPMMHLPLAELAVHRTGVCAPADAAFQAWLATVDFRGHVCGATNRDYFDDPTLAAGVTAVRAYHLTQLRTWVNVVRLRCGIAPAGWTDQLIERGVTPIRALHLTELGTALAQADRACNRMPPRYVGQVRSGTPIQAGHFMELRDAVVEALEATAARNGP